MYTSFVNKRIYYLTNAIIGIHIKSSQGKLSGELYLFFREGEMGFVQRSHRTVLKLSFD